MACGQVPFADEASRDVHGRGTVLWVVGEWRETLIVEAWCEEPPQRYAIAVALEDALAGPAEERFSVLLRVPDYYDQTVRFTVLGGAYPDDPDMAAKGRRQGTFRLQMEYLAVRLRHYAVLQPSTEVHVLEPGEVEVALEPELGTGVPGGVFGEGPFGEDPWGTG